MPWLGQMLSNSTEQTRAKIDELANRRRRTNRSRFWWFYVIFRVPVLQKTCIISNSYMFCFLQFRRVTHRAAERLPQRLRDPAHRSAVGSLSPGVSVEFRFEPGGHLCQRPKAVLRDVAVTVSTIDIPSTGNNTATWVFDRAIGYSVRLHVNFR
jgi:hypothetical protein